ncbi:hypothetical protein EDC01DRAFT_679498 [Geopyxis carbonaria]|nr:hypothetical protein EDC01DRAFT_679498 [Geopyxis carbonaria]
MSTPTPAALPPTLAPIPPRTPYSLSPEAFTALLTTAHTLTQQYMSRFDPSHDYAHIQRVCALAARILAALQTPSTAAEPTPELDTNVVQLAAVLHDIGDHKYLSDDAAAGPPSQTPVKDLLLAAGCPAGLADAVQCVVAHVSFSHESKNPGRVAAVLAVYPELGVVQDADRLDALGAVGIARCFVYGGCKNAGRGLEGSVEHFGEKLGRLGGMMKTVPGRAMARVRSERVAVFEGWWREEVEGVGGEGMGGKEGEMEDKVGDAYEGFENI